MGTKVSTGLTLDVDRDIAIDFSQDVDPESGTAIATQLANLANASALLWQHLDTINWAGFYMMEDGAQ